MHTNTDKYPPARTDTHTLAPTCTHTSGIPFQDSMFMGISKHTGSENKPSNCRSSAWRFVWLYISACVYVCVCVCVWIRLLLAQMFLGAHENVQYAWQQLLTRCLYCPKMRGMQGKEERVRAVVAGRKWRTNQLQKDQERNEIETCSRCQNVLLPGNLYANGSERESEWMRECECVWDRRESCAVLRRVISVILSMHDGNRPKRKCSPEWDAYANWNVTTTAATAAAAAPPDADAAERTALRIPQNARRHKQTHNNQAQTTNDTNKRFLFI